MRIMIGLDEYYNSFSIHSCLYLHISLFIQYSIHIRLDNIQRMDSGSESDKRNFDSPENLFSLWLHAYIILRLTRIGNYHWLQ